MKPPSLPTPLLLACLAATLALPQTALASLWTGNANDQLWATAGNWNSNYDSGSTPPATGNSIWLDANATSSNHPIFTSEQGTLSVSAIYMYGVAGSHLDLTGGSLTANSLGMATDAGSSATFNLSGGTFETTGELQVGVSAAGTLTQTGGTLSSSSYLVVGRNNGSNGTLNLGGGTVNGATTSGFTAVGSFAGSTGTVNVSGTGVFNSPLAMRIGEGGTGTLVQTGGTVSVGGVTHVGYGGSNTTTQNGTLTVSGGTFTSEGDLELGYAGSSSAQATVNVNGGTLNVGSTTKRWLIVGRWDSPNTTINVDSGSLNLNTNTDLRMKVGNTGGGTNVVNLNGGAITSFSDNQTTANGAGVVDLMNAGTATTSNTFNLNGGTLSVRAVITANDNATATFNFNGGTLKATGDDGNFVNLGGANQKAYVKEGGAVVDSNNYNVTIVQPLLHGGDAAIDGGLVKNSTGKLTLTGTNTYTGGTKVNAGTLQITGDSQLGAVPGTPTVNLTLSGATLDNNNSDPSLAANRTVFLAADSYLQAGWAKSLTVNGLITGAGGLGINWDSGTIVVSAANDYAGNTTIGTAGPAYWVDNTANPTLKLGADNALPHGAGKGNLVFGTSANNNTPTLDLNGHNARINGLSGSSNAVIDNKSGTGTYTLTVGDNDQGGTFGGVIKNTSGTLALTKTGSGTLTLTGANTFTGAVAVNGGTLHANPGNGASNRAFSYASGITVNSGATLVTCANGLFGWNDNQEHPITVNSGGILTTDENADVGVGTVTLAGGTLANVGVNPDYGTWRFDDATDKLAVTEDSTVTALNVKFQNGAEIDVSAGKTLSFTGTITDTKNGGVSSVVKTGVGKLTLTNANTYTGGTTLSAGTLNVNNAAAIGTGALTITGGTLDNTSGAAIAMTTNNAQKWNGDFSFAGSYDLDLGTGAVAIGGTGDRTVTVAGTLTVGEVRSATLGLVKQGAGTLVLTSTGINSKNDGSIIGGVLNVATGTLQMNRTGAPDADSGDVTASGGVTGAGTITNGAAGQRWLFSKTSGSADFSGTLANGPGAGALGFNMAGTGTQTLSGANTYTGVTTVGAGTLVVNGSLGDTAVTVANGAKLMGSGTIGSQTTKAASVTIQSGGTHSPGNSPGVQTINGASTYASGSIFEWDLAASKDGTTGSRGTDYDGVDVSGNISVSTTGTIFKVILGDAAWTDMQDTSNAFWNTPYGTQTWNMSAIFGKGLTSGSSFASVTTNQDVSRYGSFTINGTALTWTAVPELSNLLVGGVLAAGLLRRRRIGARA